MLKWEYDIRVYFIIFFTVCLFNLNSIMAHENGIDPVFKYNVELVMHQYVDDDVTPGCSVMVGLISPDGEDRILYKDVYGKRNETETLTPDTLYDLASVTKPTFTAMAVMLLIEDGLISDEDFVYTYVPGFESAGKSDVKIKHLLTHTSGLKAYTTTDGLPSRPDPDSLISHICSLSKSYNTGEDYVYSCLNYIILARIVENVTGECIQSFLQNRLWDETGMIDATYFPTTEQVSRTAPTLSPSTRDRGRVHDPLAWYYTDYDVQAHACGNAGGFVTMDDLSRICRLLLHGGELFGKDIYSQDNCNKVTTEQSSISGYTYGWRIVTSSVTSGPENQTPETCCLEHTGYTGPYVYLDKYSGMYIIWLVNSTYPSGGAKPGDRIAYHWYDIVRSVRKYLDIYAGVHEENFILDNDLGSPFFISSGTWLVDSYDSMIPNNYAKADAGTSSNADYHLTFDTGGRYRLSVWYPNYYGDRTTSTRYVVQNKNGSEEVFINQRDAWETWISLGEFDFDPGTYTVSVDVENSSGGNSVLVDRLMAECLYMKGDVVVDDEDAGFSATAGFTTQSTLSGFYDNGYHICSAGAGEHAFFDLVIPAAGMWEIYSWYPEDAGNSSEVVFKFEHAYGNESLEVDQTGWGGGWISLGRYPFFAGNCRVTLYSSSSGNVIADAVRARPVYDHEIIIDDLHGDFSAGNNYSKTVRIDNIYDNTCQVAAAGSSGEAVWKLDLPWPGDWELFEWHDDATGRTSNAPCNIIYHDGEVNLDIDQSINGGKWNSLGVYTFGSEGGSVKINAEQAEGDTVAADAVKAVYKSPAVITSASDWTLYE